MQIRSPESLHQQLPFLHVEPHRSHLLQRVVEPTYGMTHLQPQLLH